MRWEPDVRDPYNNVITIAPAADAFDAKVAELREMTEKCDRLRAEVSQQEITIDKFFGIIFRNHCTMCGAGISAIVGMICSAIWLLRLAFGMGFMALIMVGGGLVTNWTVSLLEDRR